MICNSEVTESKSFKLLRMTIDIDLKWKGHIYGKRGFVVKLEPKVVYKKRLSNFIHKTSKKIS